MSLLYEALLPPGLLAARPAFGSQGRVYFATDTTILYYDTGAAWVTYAGPSGAHDILSATHSDADPQAVTRGSIIFGDVTPEWSELVVGAIGEVLTVNAGGTEPEWAAASGGGVWEFISETVLGAPAASITFAAIAGTYRALVFLVQARTSQAAEWDGFDWRCNADAGANYNWIYFNAGGANARFSAATRGSTAGRSGQIEGANSRANLWGLFEVWFHGYALADREKTAVAVTDKYGDLSVNADVVLTMSAGHWENTNAITSITFLPAVGPNFVTATRIALYGVT